MKEKEVIITDETETVDVNGKRAIITIKQSDRKANREDARTVVFRDGVKVDMSIGSDQWVDEAIIKEEMEYISKMTEGLITGTMSNDREYVVLKNKIIKDLISDKIVSVKNKLCEAARKRNEIYDSSESLQNKTTKRINDATKEMAKDGVTFTVSGANEVGSNMNSANLHNLYECSKGIIKDGKEKKIQKKAFEKMDEIIESFL